MCVVGVALSVASTALGMAAANREAKATAAAYNSQAQTDEANARIARQQAEDAISRGQTEEDQLRQKATRFKASQKAAFAASGTDTTMGSAIDVITDTSFLSEQDAANVRYNASQQSLGFRQQANNYMFQARGNRAAAKNARTAGKMKMFSTLIGGATTMADRMNQMRGDG